ncbi:MAG: HAMP domain-containing sensor histidine kinase [Lawsonibacter sp.]|nr:HAMP domain-containing sensor histidine kinase [Lawsonibacter sp.]
MEPNERRTEKKPVPFFASLQVKYAISYLVIFAVVLILMNTYPVMASQELLFTSKRDSLKSKTAVISSTLMELESLSSDQVVRVINMLDNMGLSRILVTDPAGLILYDSLKDGLGDGEQPKEEKPKEPEYRYALYQEVVTALRGKDVFYSQYSDKVFTSTAASPIIYRGVIIGAVYILEVDQAQGALLLNLQQNLRNISIVIAAVTLVMSTFFSKMLTARIAALLRAIRIVGEGEYGHRLQPVGRDELAQLAEEFNQLTDRLQTTEEVRRRFVSDASHELKTPLASIRLLADSILQNEQMDEETVRDFVTDIGDESDRLTRITEHLLALTRLDSLPAGRTMLVDAAAVLERAVGMLMPVADAAGVTMLTDLKPGCMIRCTEDDFYQICFNLIENAIKYNFPDGYVYVSVYKDGDQVLLEVADTGVGIPEDDLPKIFNRFYRVDKARSRAAGGTGLGLSIVRDTVRRHGGWVTARTRNPEGSIFTVGFPQDRGEVEERQ